MASSIEAYLLALTSTMGQGIMATPVSTTANGTPGGATETLDSVLGTYQFNAVAGRRYCAVMNGLLGLGTTGETYLVRIRNSNSASAPTNTSTLIAENAWACQNTGSGGRIPIPLGNTFIASVNGTNTIGFFSIRLLGANSFTPESPAAAGGVLPREMYVVDLGVF